MRNRILACLAASLSISLAADRVTLTGKVTDSSGKPLEDATVMIYHAGVKKGYSTFCPSCYTDCGKRTVTDSDGSFIIPKLDPDLRFKLLVVHDGYVPKFVAKVDPALGPAETAALSARTAVNDPDRVGLGRVVDSHGRPVRDAVVFSEGVATTMEGKGPISMYGTIPGLEPVAITNPNGEFELAYGSKASGILVRVDARGMAPKVIAVPTGAARKIISVSDGAVIRGRLMDHGKPVAGVEVGLFPQHAGGFGGNLKIIGDPYQEVRIGTEEDGTFVIPNVPAPVDWYVYGKMESIAARGATPPVECATRSDQEEVNAGDIQIQPGHSVRGQVTLADGAAVADGMRLTINSKRGFDSQTVVIGHDGRFEFTGVPTGDYEIFTSVRGYQLSGGQHTLPQTVDRDIADVAIVLDPAPRR
jgi:carboxypeptidase family protein